MPATNIDVKNFTGRVKLTAKKLDPDAYFNIGKEIEFNINVEGFIQTIIRHYDSPPIKNADTIESCKMKARGEFRSNVGQFYKKVATAVKQFAEQYQMIKRMKIKISPNQAAAASELLRKEQEQFEKLEKKFCNALVAWGAFDITDLPNPLYCTCDAINNGPNLITHVDSSNEISSSAFNQADDALDGTATPSGVKDELSTEH